jgi:hypothetical protein
MAATHIATLEQHSTHDVRTFLGGLWSNAAVLASLALLVLGIAIGNAIRRLLKDDGALGNFLTFRNAAIALAQGRNLYSGPHNEYVYPPLIAFLYQPLTRISPHAGAAAVLAANSILSVLTLWMAAAELSRRFLGSTNRLLIARAAVIGALLTADKIRGEFNLWETNVLMLFMFTSALVLADRRPALAGAAMGFAFNIKYMPLTLLPFLLLRRRWGMAGGFVASALFFSLLPAVSMGWSGNLQALATAYGGLAGLFGVHATHAAHLYPMTDWRTVSLTSGIARFTGWPDQYAVMASATMGVAFVAGVALVYRRNRLPLLRWPAAREQVSPPYSALFGLEWVVVILLTLIFSPFTNVAHLYILLLANVAGAVLLQSLNPAAARPLIVGLICMYVGIMFPPGGNFFRDAQRSAKWIGLPAWGMLIYAPLLIWAGVTCVRFRTGALSQAAPIDRTGRLSARPA